MAAVQGGMRTLCLQSHYIVTYTHLYVNLIASRAVGALTGLVIAIQQSRYTQCAKAPDVSVVIRFYKQLLTEYGDSYILNLDTAYAKSLLKTASPRLEEVLIDAIQSHIAFRSTMRVKIFVSNLNS